MWIPQLACPGCRAGFGSVPEGSATACVRCGCGVERRGGVLRCIGALDSERDRLLVTQYRAVRDGDGFRRADAQYYQTLPWVSDDDPRAAEWRIRRSSLAALTHLVLPDPTPARHVADLGAGCGWLAHRLTEMGHAVVAVDLLDDDRDGLGACRHYDVSFAKVQADFDALPFGDAQFDLVVFNASLHYSPDPERSLAAARRLLSPRGAIAVVDSPMFDRVADGERMVADELTRFAETRGVDRPVRLGVGFLTYERLDRRAGRLGLTPRFVPTRGPLVWRLRRQLGRVRLGRAPATFGVWVAR